MKYKFKVGDKVVIAKFPMGMVSGDDDVPRLWYEHGKVFTIKEFRMDSPQLDGPNRNEDIPCCTTIEERWYFDLGSLALAKGYKRKHIKWSLSCGK